MNLKLPPALEEAKKSRKGFPWIVEILIFILVFLVATLVEAVIMMPGLVIAMFSETELVDSITMALS